MQPETPSALLPRVEWKAQLASRAGAYHRVERAGAHPTEEPVALVKDAKDCVAISANQEMLQALRAVRDEALRVQAGGERSEGQTRTLAILVIAAIEKAEGRIR